MFEKQVDDLVTRLRKMIESIATKMYKSMDHKIDNIRIGADNIKLNSIESRHLSLRAKNSLPTLNRNYILDSDLQVLSSAYLIGEYTASELINDLDYTFVVYGLVNSGQQIMVSFNDGNDGAFAASFDSNGYAIIHAHTPLTIDNENVRFYNYPESTATVGSIGWVCMYRGYVKNPSMSWNIAPEDTGQRIGESESSIELLGNEILAKVGTGELFSYLSFTNEDGVTIGKTENNTNLRMSVNITNEQFNIKDNGETVSFINGQTLNIRNAEITETEKLGPSYFVVTPRGFLIK